VVAIDPFYKKVLRFGWRNLQGALSLFGGFFGNRGIRIWYAGARSGNVGGPLVKVQRLRAFFPETKTFFSHVYLLSNSPYLPAWTIRFLKWRGVPLILNQNGVFYPAWFDGDWEAKNEEMAVAWRAADYVLYQSEFCRKTAERFLGSRSGPGEVLFNAVDLEKFKPDPNRNNARPILLHTGKLVPHMFYRVEALLRGFSMARNQGLNAELRIAGWMEASVEQSIFLLLDELSLQNDVSVLGEYDQDNAPSIYCAADAYVTLTYNDACPSAVIEALACGLPVLYSESGGVPELVTERSGIGLTVNNGYQMIDVPSIEQISTGMIHILIDLCSRQAAARNRAEEAFDLKNWIERHRIIFNDLSRKK
jgi:glycosyltransferase involved in cell wall biosynthesis